MTSNSGNKHNVSNVTLLDRTITNDKFDSCLEDHMRIIIYNKEAGTLCTLRNDAILGGEGDDVISGTEKGETIYGGNGNDNITGGKGDDIIYGNDGNDVIKGNQGDDYISGGKGDDSIYGNRGSDVISGYSGNDRISGGEGDDIIYGDAGNDNISGDEGDDSIYGGDGNDVIKGNEGDDILRGDIGSDNLSGGSGKDVFHYYKIDDSMFNSPDKIIDFETGSDTIDISALSQIKGNTIEIKQVNHFSNQKNEMIVHYNQSENLTNLMLDCDGDGKADFLIEIIGEINPIADIVT